MSDIWSLGCVIYHLVTHNNHVFHGKDSISLYSEIKNRNIKKTKVKAIDRLLLRIFKIKPEKRINLKEIIILLDSIINKEVDKIIAKERKQIINNSIFNIFRDCFKNSSKINEDNDECDINTNGINYLFIDRTLISLLTDAYYPLSLLKKGVKIRNNYLIKCITKNYSIKIII